MWPRFTLPGGGYNGMTQRPGSFNIIGGTGDSEAGETHDYTSNPGCFHDASFLTASSDLLKFESSLAPGIRAYYRRFP